MPEAIAGPLGLPIGQVEAALSVLESVDEKSGSPELNGRRLERISPGRWSIVNYVKYRDIRRSEDRREQNRQAKERQRTRERESASVINGQHKSAMSANADTDADGDVDAEKPKPLSSRKPRTSEPVGFAEFYAAYPRRTKRRRAARAFEQALKRHPDWEPADLLGAAKGYAGDCKGKEQTFIPHPSTWLNDDEFLEQLAGQ